MIHVHYISHLLLSSFFVDSGLDSFHRTHLHSQGPVIGIWPQIFRNSPFFQIGNRLKGLVAIPTFFADVVFLSNVLFAIFTRDCLGK